MGWLVYKEFLFSLENYFNSYAYVMSGWPSGLRRCVQVAVRFCGRGFESHFWQDLFVETLIFNKKYFGRDTKKQPVTICVKFLCTALWNRMVALGRYMKWVTPTASLIGSLDTHPPFAKHHLTGGTWPHGVKNHWCIKCLSALQTSSKNIVSPTGNRTPVSRVTGGDTYHYTIEDWRRLQSDRRFWKPCMRNVMF